MPHVRIRAMKESDVRTLSEVLPAQLALMMKTSEDNFTVEKLTSVYYRAGQIVKDGDGDPMIEIHWFDRGAEVKELVAKKITEVVRGITHAEYISVIFFDLPKENYFENGVHF